MMKLGLLLLAFQAVLLQLCNGFKLTKDSEISPASVLLDKQNPVLRCFKSSGRCLLSQENGKGGATSSTSYEFGLDNSKEGSPSGYIGFRGQPISFSPGEQQVLSPGKTIRGPIAYSLASSAKELGIATYLVSLKSDMVTATFFNGSAWNDEEMPNLEAGLSNTLSFTASEEMVPLNDAEFQVVLVEDSEKKVAKLLNFSTDGSSITNVSSPISIFNTSIVQDGVRSLGCSSAGCISVSTLSGSGTSLVADSIIFRIRKRPDLLLQEWDQLADEQIELLQQNPLAVEGRSQSGVAAVDPLFSDMSSSLGCDVEQCSAGFVTTSKQAPSNQTVGVASISFETGKWTPITPFETSETSQFTPPQVKCGNSKCVAVWTSRAKSCTTPNRFCEGGSAARFAVFNNKQWSTPSSFKDTIPNETPFGLSLECAWDELNCCMVSMSAANTTNGINTRMASFCIEDDDSPPSAAASIQSSSPIVMMIGTFAVTKLIR